MNLADRFEAVVRRSPDRDALVAAGLRRTFDQLDRRANQVARLLRVKSIGPGDAVGVAVDDRAVRIEALLAILKVRGVPFDVGAGADPADVTAVLGPVGARGMVVSRVTVGRLGAMLLELPGMYFFVVVDDGSDADVLLPNAVFYEEGRQAYDPTQEWPPRSADDAYGVVRREPGGLRPVATAHADLGPDLDPVLATLLAGDTAVL